MYHLVWEAYIWRHDLLAAFYAVLAYENSKNGDQFIKVVHEMKVKRLACFVFFDKQSWFPNSVSLLTDRCLIVTSFHVLRYTNSKRVLSWLSLVCGTKHHMEHKDVIFYITPQNSDIRDVIVYTCLWKTTSNSGGWLAIVIRHMAELGALEVYCTQCYRFPHCHILYITWP